MAGRAASPAAVQVIEDRLEELEIVSYVAKHLQLGDKLNIQVTGTSGSLDPYVLITHASLSVERLLAEAKAWTEEMIDKRHNLHEAFPTFAKRHLLAWDDDAGPGYSASVLFTAPRDGDYRLMLSGGLNLCGLGDIARRTSGAYRFSAQRRRPCRRDQ